MAVQIFNFLLLLLSEKDVIKPDYHRLAWRCTLRLARAYEIKKYENLFKGILVNGMKICTNENFPLYSTTESTDSRRICRTDFKCMVSFMPVKPNCVSNSTVTCI